MEYEIEQYLNRLPVETSIRFYYSGSRYGAELTRTGVKSVLTDETFDSLRDWLLSVTGRNKISNWSDYVNETYFCRPDSQEWKSLAEVLEALDCEDSEFLD